MSVKAKCKQTSQVVQFSCILYVHSLEIQEYSLHAKKCKFDLLEKKKIEKVDN